MKQSHGAPRRPTLLIILDGFGVNPSKKNNAIAEANTPFFDEYFAIDLVVDDDGYCLGAVPIW